jgi:hypothetical protein
MKKLLFLVTLAFFLNVNSAQAQCPMCKTALKSNQNGANKASVGNGINNGILFLLTMPYVLVGTAGLVWYNARRKGKNA